VEPKPGDGGAAIEDLVDQQGDAEDGRDENRDKLNQERRIAKARKTTREWRQYARGLERDLELAEARIEAMLSLRDAGDPIVVKSRKKSGKGEATAWPLAGDWHAEENVRPEQVNGLNRFNLEIADKRITKFYQNVALVLEINRHGVDIPTIIHPLLGDFFSGHIHEDLAEITELSPTESVKWLVRRLEGGIRYLLDQADPKRLILPCTIGNHSRTTKKPRVSTAQKHSLEWLMYHWLADRFEHEKEVEFTIAEGYHLMVDCHGLQMRIHHGDWMNYQGGIGGLSIPLLKAIAQWDTSIRADIDVIAHWHQFRDYGKAVVNGSLIGWSPYSIKIKAAFEPPTQAFFLVDAEHRRKTMCTPIFLE
jgi:hypothetical protein